MTNIIEVLAILLKKSIILCNTIVYYITKNNIIYFYISHFENLVIGGISFFYVLICVKRTCYYCQLTK